MPCINDVDGDAFDDLCCDGLDGLTLDLIPIMDTFQMIARIQHHGAEDVRESVLSINLASEATVETM